MAGDDGKKLTGRRYKTATGKTIIRLKQKRVSECKQQLYKFLRALAESDVRAFAIVGFTGAGARPVKFFTDGVPLPVFAEIAASTLRMKAQERSYVRYEDEEDAED